MEPITFDEVHVLDANSEYRGIPTKTLMENAGRGAAEHILDTGGKGKRVLILCGSGNNGGDGYVAARYLANKVEVEVVLLRSRDRVRSEIAWAALRHAEEVGVPLLFVEEVDLASKVSGADIIVDAMLGVGVSGAPRGVYATAIELMNASGKRIVSVDIPTGWGTELVVTPESTVTFHAPKIGMGPECGEIVVKPIGVPEEAERYAGPGELLLIPAVAREAHKGDRGNVLVIGGGPYTGAPSLAALTAHRCGIDLVFVAVPATIADVVRCYSMDLIVLPIGSTGTAHLVPEHLGAVLEQESRCDAAVIGPGLGDDPASLALAGAAYRKLAEAGKAVVVDADGLKAFSGMGEVPRNARAVLTPHSGEFAILAGQKMPKDLDGRVEAVRGLASSMGCTVLSKGPIDVVSDGRRVKLNDTGNPAMATGGTGDVLSGAVGALLAKGMDAFDAARTAAFLVGAAGDATLSQVGHSMLASDVLDRLPAVLAKHLPWWTRR
jgi:NAD(P)H-hydrate epimerase